MLVGENTQTLINKQLLTKQNTQYSREELYCQTASEALCIRPIMFCVFMRSTVNTWRPNSWSRPMVCEGWQYGIKQKQSNFDVMFKNMGKIYLARIVTEEQFCFLKWFMLGCNIEPHCILQYMVKTEKWTKIVELFENHWLISKQKMTSTFYINHWFCVCLWVCHLCY